MGRFCLGETSVEGSHTVPVRDLTWRRDVTFVESGESGNEQRSAENATQDATQ
jgi:hypothetical protein